jgi:hypothetical protein
MHIYTESELQPQVLQITGLQLDHLNNYEASSVDVRILYVVVVESRDDKLHKRLQ